MPGGALVDDVADDRFYADGFGATVGNGIDERSSDNKGSSGLGVGSDHGGLCVLATPG